MKTLLSAGDLFDIARKFRFKGRSIVKRLFVSEKEKVAGTWDQTELPPSNWWNVPAVRARWNEKITGDPSLGYPEWVRERFLKGKNGLHMVSPGCGTGSHEQLFAPFAEIGSIMAFDISAASIARARENAGTKTDYRVLDFYEWMKEENDPCDILLFYSSLHHFKDLHELIPALRNKLKPGGLLIVHEYVGPDRMMWTREQLAEVRRLLKTLPDAYRKFAMGKGVKTRHYRPGLWRTLLSDPSESIESSRIVPLLNTHFQPLYQQDLGGNILHLLLKDIAHHFTGNDEKTGMLLQTLFEAEDAFLEKQASDFHFGVYGLK